MLRRVLEITSDGIRKTLPSDSAASEVLPMGVPDYVIIGAIALVVAIGAAGLFDQARGRVVGSDLYLTKPFTKEELLAAVAQHAAS